MGVLQARGSGAPNSRKSNGKETAVKVYIYKLPEGRIDIMVEAATGHGKAPVVLQNVTKLTMPDRLAPVLAAQQGRRQPSPGGPG